MKKLPFEIHDSRKLRVIIDTDAGCEADDQYAIVHAFMSGKIEVRAILAEHFNHIPGSMQLSYDEILKVCELAGRTQIPVLKGAPEALGAAGDDVLGVGSDVPEISPAGSFLIEEALRDDPRPLYILCQGALTNIAAALMQAPEIEERIQIIIVSGVNYPAGGFEFNTMNDPSAFNIVMSSRAGVWVIPEEVYATMQTGMLELYTRVSTCGRIGEYLYNKTAETALNMAQMLSELPGLTPFETAISFPNGESWSLGDSTAIGLLLMHHAGAYDEVAAPNVLSDGTYFIPEQRRRIRWYKSINQRFILEDFYQKLAYFYR